MKVSRIFILTALLSSLCIGTTLFAQSERIDSTGLKSKVWLEDFNDNNNNWDVYVSPKTESKIKDGVYSITSKIERGTVRYISIPLTSRDFEIESQIKVIDGQRSSKIGLIFGFKNYDNYNFFVVLFKRYYVGQVLNGEFKYQVNGLPLREEIVSTTNTFKIRTDFDQCYYYLNGTLLNVLQTPVIVGTNLGFILDGLAEIKVNWLRVENKNIGKTEKEKAEFAKPMLNGLCLQRQGYILTTLIPELLKNNIVIETALEGVLKHYKAKLVSKDSINGLALIKVEDSLFTEFQSPSFLIKNFPSISEQQDQFCLQLPLQNSLVKKDHYIIKGKVMAKKGFASNTAMYQLSQDKNDLINGAPIFTEAGECIGLFNKQKSEFDGVCYAVKMFYFKNLLDFLPEEPEFQVKQNVQNLSLDELVTTLSPLVVLIKIY